MRKILIIFLLIGLIFTQEQTSYGKVSYKYYNDVWGQFYTEELNFKYSLENDTSYMYYGDVLTTSAYLFTKKEREILKEIIGKYIEWREKAIEKEVTLDKRIEIDLRSEAAFTYGEEWFWDNSALIVGTFFSRNAQTHELVLQFGKITSKSNKYIDHTPEQIYLTYKNVLELKKIISEKEINQAIMKINKQKSIEDDFN